MPDESKSYPIEEAIRAQNALRKLAGLGAEMFPIQSFVGMISDEIETLRKQGHTDQQIAQTIAASSKIDITATDITTHYASPEDRHQPHE
ncbi:hypothetical protein [Tunturiibacter gelidoferens]|uniref:Uncharacterized protein n=3 Tax=Tunturiibacter TaxID=3154218 RepID=A0A7Y9NK59_9BACT|nr:hypothetical protein [Edaphobacter lichenicola]MBB5339789.1 hypothetical protein [Edaphobacter lichenicola]NYF50890.1 hypothetical protein [Edaphobacter lichenicola]